MTFSMQDQQDFQMRVPLITNNSKMSKFPPNLTFRNILTTLNCPYTPFTYFTKYLQYLVFQCSCVNRNCSNGSTPAAEAKETSAFSGSQSLHHKIEKMTSDGQILQLQPRVQQAPPLWKKNPRLSQIDQILLRKVLVSEAKVFRNGGEGVYLVIFFSGILNRFQAPRKRVPGRQRSLMVWRLGNKSYIYWCFPSMFSSISNVW